jgi:hypothetical protein
LILAAPFPPTEPVAPSPDAIQGFGQALNNCAPENYATLPEDQRAKCQRPGAGIAVEQAPNLMDVPSHVENNDYWAAQLAARNSPERVDCTHLETQTFGQNKQVTSGFVDLVCAFNQQQGVTGFLKTYEGRH